MTESGPPSVLSMRFLIMHWCAYHGNLLEASDSEKEGMEVAWRVEANMEEGPPMMYKGSHKGMNQIYVFLL